MLSLGASAVGLVLAEDVRSDLDMPPFDKALMDGYALHTADLSGDASVLTIVEEITAGRTPCHILQPGQTARVMTGAPLPQGADAVVQHERTTLLNEKQVRIDVASLKPGANVMPFGREMRRGEVVVPCGAVLRPEEFGVLATVGRTQVLAHPAPEVAILSTGDEIVDASVTPGAGQIRNGNGSMLLAQVVRAGGVPRSLGIAGDSVESLAPLIREGLRSPVLILSGGVSAGKLDLVPAVLERQGVTIHFHKVTMKPGKPILFGCLEPGPRLVFGLPGNPVSALICFELFVRPALRQLRGHSDVMPHLTEAALGEDFPYRTDRPTYHPARVELTPTGWRVRPVPWFGSPDLRGLIGANAFVVLPIGDHVHRAGQRFAVLRLDP
jgi:molybdopterin molybdotransferase